MERRRKESHLDTVNYEIEMLDFCFKKTRRKNSKLEGYLAMEGFLLHYRNLLEFFSGKHKSSNVSTYKPRTWAGRELTDLEKAAFVAPSLKLNADYYGKISTFLQHCTRARHEEVQGWDPDEMKRAMDEVIAGFRRTFPATE